MAPGGHRHQPRGADPVEGKRHRPERLRELHVPLLYSGSAQYTEVYGTSTAVTSSQNPSTVGNAVTYTATVTASATASQDPVPSSPTGTVAFYDGTVTPAHVIPGCSAVTAASATTTTAKATCLSPVYATTGTHSITAVYTNTDGNFTGSTSPVFTQTVNPVSTTLALTSAPNPSTFGQSVTFSAQTTPASGPTGTVSFYQCTTAACTSTFLLGTGPLNATGKATFATTALPGGTDYVRAVYGGDTHYATATSNVVTQTVNYTTPCITTTINGGYTVKSGQAICICSPGRVNGGVTVQSGGSLVLNGATINGNITATSANALRFCGSTINGNITATGTTGYIVIGDGGDDGPPGCAANTITGNVTLTSSKGGFEIAGHNVTGTVTLTGNTGSGPTSEDASPEVEGNKITGSLSCATSNSPAITDGGQKNTVSGTKSGQCAASAVLMARRKHRRGADRPDGPGRPDHPGAAPGRRRDHRGDQRLARLARPDSRGRGQGLLGPGPGPDASTSFRSRAARDDPHRVGLQRAGVQWRARSRRRRRQQLLGPGQGSRRPAARPHLCVPPHRSGPRPPSLWPLTPCRPCTR